MSIREYISRADWPAPLTCQCHDCGLVLPVAGTDWERVTNFDAPARKEHGVEAVGLCASCHAKRNKPWEIPASNERTLF